MHTKTDEGRFHEIRRRWLEKVEREETYRMDVLYAKYRSRMPERSWMTKGELDRIERMRTAQDRESDKMFGLLDRIGGRDWRSHAPHHWVMRELTFADATTTGALSIVPPPSYGCTEQRMLVFASART